MRCSRPATWRAGAAGWAWCAGARRSSTTTSSRPPARCGSCCTASSRRSREGRRPRRADLEALARDHAAAAGAARLARRRRRRLAPDVARGRAARRPLRRRGRRHGAARRPGAPGPRAPLPGARVRLALPRHERPAAVVLDVDVRQPGQDAPALRAPAAGRGVARRPRAKQARAVVAGLTRRDRRAVMPGYAGRDGPRSCRPPGRPGTPARRIAAPACCASTRPGTEASPASASRAGGSRSTPCVRCAPPPASATASSR